eukprot:278515_1
MLGKHRILKTPCTLITGFLGAGKTTLLNHILSHPPAHAPRLAVIENEFALEFGVENELLQLDNDDQLLEVFEFGQGCICCSSATEFMNALSSVSRDRIDHVLVETTGLADPGPVLDFMQSTPGLSDRFAIQSVVTVVDAATFRDRLKSAEEVEEDEFKNEAVAQVLCADRILVNKTDLAKEDELNRLEKALSEINPVAEILRCSHSVVDTRTLLSEPFNSCACTLHDLRAHAKSSTLSARNKDHNPRLRGVSCACAAPLREGCREEVYEWVRKILNDKNVLRVKAVLWFSGSDDKSILQGVVGGQLTIEPRRSRVLVDQNERHSVIVVIGYDVNHQRERLQQEFRDFSRDNWDVS